MTICVNFVSEFGAQLGYENISIYRMWSMMLINGWDECRMEKMRKVVRNVLFHILREMFYYTHGRV